MKISVTLPNFNHGSLIGGNIERVIKQTYGNWELLIVDDGSTDDSWSVIERYRASDPRIVAKRSERNRGALVTIGECLKMCTGDLLYGSAADDYLDDPRFFEVAASALADNGAAAGVFGQSRVVDGVEGGQLWVMGGSAGGGGYIDPARAADEFAKGQLFVPGASAMWRRALVERHGGFDPELGPQTDYFINHALPMLYGAVFLEKVVSVTRLFRNSYGAASGDADFFSYHALAEKKFISLPLQPRLSDDWRRSWRWNVTNGRLAITRQRQFIELIRDYRAQIQPWEESSLPPLFQKCCRDVESCCDELESNLTTRIEGAERIFESVAGHVPAARLGVDPAGGASPSAGEAQRGTPGNAVRQGLIGRIRARLGPRRG